MDEETDVFNLLIEASVNLQQAGFPKLAVEALKKAEEIDPENAPLHFLLGLAYRDVGRIVEAENHLRRAIDLEPGDGDALESLALLLAEQDRSAEALELLRQLSASHSTDQSVVLSVAVALMKLDNFEEATRVLSYAWKESRSPEIGKLYGYLLSHQKQESEADEVFKQVVQESQNSDDLFELALFLDGTERQGDTITVLEKLVSLDPERAEAWKMLAYLYYYQEERAQESMRAIERAVQADPEDLESWLIQAQIYLDAGRVGEALTSAESGLSRSALGESDADLLKHDLTEIQVRALVNLGKLKRALKEVNKGLAQLPDSAKYLELRSEILEKLGRLEGEQE